MLSFDIEAYLLANAPAFSDYAETISHWSGRTSISPKIILSLIEHQSQSLSNADSPETLNAALANLSQQENLSARIQDVAIRLAENYYRNLAENINQPEMKSLSALLRDGTKTPTKPSQKQDTDAVDFIDTFFRLFPNASLIQETKPNSKNLKSVPAQSLLQLPFPVGQAWQTWGGTHTDTGQPGGPYSSLDFRQNRNRFGSDTSNIWVSSASRGRAVRHSSCFAEVLASGGWSTAYYHLDNIRVNTGQTVSKNTRLANYANNHAQSICGGGASNGPHLHFSLKRNGVYVSLDGVELSGYEVHTGRSNYDSDCNHFWLSQSGKKFCNGTPIPNRRTSAPSPDLSVTTVLISEQELNTNQSFSISTRLNNVGASTSAASRLIFLLSTDPTISLNDVKLTELQTDKLLTSQSALYSTDFLKLNVAGSFWLGACVLTVAGESNSANNCTTAAPVIVTEKQKNPAMPGIILLLGDQEAK